mgnify:CR=1 FL=1
MVNAVLHAPYLPKELFTARLICLNKEASKTGKLDSIRPISVIGFVHKIIDFVLNDRIKKFVYRNKLICDAQVGFMEKCGTEINIMKIMAKAYEANQKFRSNHIYIFFIDFRKAYDSVDHEILFQKLEKYKFPSNIINTLRKIYSVIQTKISFYGEPIFVNVGLMQGALTSPILFNLFINDLLIELKEVTFCALGYADDTAAVCVGGTQADDAIETTTKWSEKNKIQLNKRKSAILPIFEDSPKDKDYLGFPIVKSYKYLGVLINFRLKCFEHITKVAERINVYLSRNRMLKFKDFSPRSLFTIFTYFQKSRIVYGLGCFINDEKTFTKVSTIYHKLLKSIMHFSTRCNLSKLRLSLGLINIKYKLVISNLKIQVKLKREFNIVTDIYDKKLKEILGDKIFKREFNESTDWYELEKELKIKSLTEDAKEVKYPTPSELFCNSIGHQWFKGYDTKEVYIFKYFADRGFFIEVKCLHCLEKENSRLHTVNECPYYNELRSQGINILKTFKRKDIKDTNYDLFKSIELIFFRPNEKVDERKDEEDFLKWIIPEFYFRALRRDWEKYRDIEEDNRYIGKLNKMIEKSNKEDPNGFQLDLLPLIDTKDCLILKDKTDRDASREKSNAIYERLMKRKNRDIITGKQAREKTLREKEKIKIKTLAKIFYFFSN